jgi:hypothetical protein
MSIPKRQTAVCGFCSHAPSAFPQAVAYDLCALHGESLKHTARSKFLWGVCADHSQAIGKHLDAPYSLGPYDGIKPGLRESHAHQYPGCVVSHFELRIIPFSSAEGAEVMAFLRGKPQMPPPLHDIPIDIFSDQAEYEEAFLPYGKPVFFKQ